METMDKIVPKATMIAVGALYGIAHGLALGMPSTGLRAIMTQTHNSGGLA